MIKRILLALDPDNDTPVAYRFAADIAVQHNAIVTGLACIDLEHIESSSGGGGIGSMYFAEKLRDRLTGETRTKAKELIQSFTNYFGDNKIAFNDAIEEGVPFQRILEDMKYHDMLVVGSEPHFFYGHPNQRTNTLIRVVKGTVAPVLIVNEEYCSVQRVVMAFEGSVPASKAMQHFVQLKPFGADLDIHLINVNSGDSKDEAKLVLDLAAEYLDAHGMNCTQEVVQGHSPHDSILEYSESVKANLIVAGAHAVSRLERFAFGSTTETLLKNGSFPLFLAG